ncbi:MAG: hypothetical protein JWO60_730 [Frankiales bacterium]|nr:hypothetical protein [Frankiales bacterium]
MALFRRRPVPEAVSALALPAGERRAAWALLEDGRPVVATARGLLLPEREGLLLWRQVERATWERPLLVVREVAEVSETGVLHELVLQDEGELPELVRQQVTGSVAWATTARLTPSGGVRIVGRRVPEAEELEWQLVFDAGTDLTDPLLRAQAEHALTSARRTIG